MPLCRHKVGHIAKCDILLSVTRLSKLPLASLNKILTDLTQMSDKKDHVYVFNLALFHISAPKVEKKKVRWADEPRQQSVTQGTLEMLTKSPFPFFSIYKKTSPRANDP